MTSATTKVSSSKGVPIEQLFHNARSHNVWLDRPVPDSVLVELYEAMEWGPTAVNCLPARIVFVKQGPEREKLLAAMAPGNVDKTRSAPITAILAYDSAFYEELPKLFTHMDAKPWYSNNPALAEETAIYNSALQHGYFLIAARALGLDCGPMAGFDKAKLDESFFAGTSWKSALVVNLGYGDASKLYPRSARLTFAEGAKIIG